LFPEALFDARQEPFGSAGEKIQEPYLVLRMDLRTLCALTGAPVLGYPNLSAPAGECRKDKNSSPRRSEGVKAERMQVGLAAKGPPLWMPGFRLHVLLIAVASALKAM